MRTEKLFYMFVFLFVFIITVNCYDEYAYGKPEELVITLFSEKIYFSNSEEVTLYVGIKNISNRDLKYFPILPIDEKWDGPEFKFNFDGTLKDDIKNNYSERNPGIVMKGGEANKFLSKEIKWIRVNLNEYYNIDNLNGRGDLVIIGKYSIKRRIKVTDIPGAYNLVKVGWKDSNKIRIFFNMEQGLIQSQIRAEPHKWNVNWEEMEGDGVFTVWIESIEGYSVEDVKQDTILFNGTLKPEEIKILPKSGNNKEKVLQLKFKKKDGIQYLGELKTGDKKTINISAQLTDEKWFIGETEIEIVGKDK